MGDVMICNHHRSWTPPGLVDYRHGNGTQSWTVECSCVATYEAIVAGETIPKADAYCAIVREAARHPEYLTDYASDLIFHDRNILAEYRGPFLWILRKLGTHIVLPSIDAKDGWTGASVVSCFGGETGHLYFWWDGRTLRALRDPKHAGETLDEEHARMRRAKGRAA